MSIVAAKCPCCGRDIGFEENTAEYTCIFCGARLHTSALKSEVLNNGAEASPARPAAVQQKPAQQAGQTKPAAPVRKEQPASGLSEEEKALQLKRKAELKDELKKVVKQIDEMRARRPKLEGRVKTAKGLMSGGIAVAVAAVFIFLLCVGEGGSNSTLGIVASIIAAIVAVATLVIASVRGREMKEELKRLEKNISEKKEKREVLIGRLNKISKRLNSEQ